MSVTAAVLCECDLCHFKKTYPEKPDDWIKLYPLHNKLEQKYVSTVVCPVCAWVIAHRMGYVTNGTCPTNT